jgi:AraC-like DNA-binding protein
MLIARPSIDLRPFVKQYWGIESCTPPKSSYDIKIIPTGLIELNFYLGCKPACSDTNHIIAENSIINGQQKSPYNICISEKLFMFSVTFQPEGAMFFFDLPLQEIFNATIPLREIFKNEIEALEQKLYMASDFNTRCSVMNNFLYHLLVRNYNHPDYKRMTNCIEIINQQKGNSDIENLASYACWSRKQLERSFQKYIGSTPKHFLRLVRFQHVLFAKQLNEELSMTQLAYLGGYFDQSHLNAEFKALTDLTPKKYFTICDPQSDYFTF